MATHDEYIKSHNPVGKVRPPENGDKDTLYVSPDEAIEAEIRLEDLKWGHGLTRDQILQQYPELPLGIYLRLPDSKRFDSAVEVLHEAQVGPSRAEGEFLGAYPDLPTKESIEDGGPPDWGSQPGIYPVGAHLESGSATDLEEPAADVSADDEETSGEETPEEE
jgi:hypothetical protein